MCIHWVVCQAALATADPTGQADAGGHDRLGRQVGQHVPRHCSLDRPCLTTEYPHLAGQVDAGEHDFFGVMVHGAAAEVEALEEQHRSRCHLGREPEPFADCLDLGLVVLAQALLLIKAKGFELACGQCLANVARLHVWVAVLAKRLLNCELQGLSLPAGSALVNIIAAHFRHEMGLWSALQVDVPGQLSGQAGAQNAYGSPLG